MSGKGDNPRPLSVSEAVFGERFDAIDWTARERERALCEADLDDDALWEQAMASAPSQDQFKADDSI